VVKTEKSSLLNERLRRVLPGGDTRSSTFYPPYPIALERGEGAFAYDVDGNRYLDFWNNFTALVHGHAHPRIVEAIRRQAELGTAFPSPHPAQAELAERIRERVSSVELLRFTNSGTEAVMLAVRAARAATGRDLLVKADGGYHGSWEQVPMTLGAGIGGQGGTPEAVTALLRVCEYNDVASLEAVMEQDGERVAAVILEPVMGSGGVITGEPAFLRAARKLCDRFGALLIFDEVITLRLAMGGQQSVVGVEPDLTAFGKIIGGGLPVGATGGRARVLELFDPTRPGFIGHSGTFNGNPVTAAAGSATLELLDAAAIAKIDDLGERLAHGLDAALRAAGTRAAVNRAGSIVQLHLDRSEPVKTYRDASMRHRLLARVHRAALDEGLLFASRGLFCTSTAMDEASVDQAVAAFSRALARAAAEPA
jgi:glutamate-1-semialdehyde 2,1-aminomutase